MYLPTSSVNKYKKFISVMIYIDIPFCHFFHYFILTNYFEYLLYYLIINIFYHLPIDVTSKITDTIL